MIDSDKLLVIGAALVQTVRSEIKYSTNMVSKGQLFDGLKQSYFFKELSLKVIYTSPFAGVSYSINDLGKKSLDLGVGYCDGLSLACLYITKGLKEIRIDKFYLSLMETHRHTFVLAHCSQNLLDYRYTTKCANSFDDLAKHKGLSNAIIIDPWIYKATKLKNYTQHLDHSELYNVKKFYKGPISSKGGIHIEISPSSQVSEIDNEYINKFNRFYETQKLRLGNEGGFFDRGRRLSSVRNSLEYNIQQQPQQKQLTSLRLFFTRLNSQLSNWYSNCCHSNRKGECISAAITYLNICINDYTYPGDAKLIELFQSILRILPIVRSSNTPPENLSINNIRMTSSARRIFNLAITPERIYAFEQINGLSLKWIRDARIFQYNDREKYNYLVEQINDFTPPYNINKILKNFYTNKNNYYNLVDNAINFG